VPYMAVYDPNLMLQPVPGLEGASYWLAVVYIVIKAGLAMLLWGAAAIGYVQARLSLWERILAGLAAALLVTASPVSDVAGFVLAAVATAMHLYRARRDVPARAA
jgi:TRAP-type uncharacterized transport system fused permease subunit